MANERTGAPQALEALAWHLNFFPKEKLSINEIAEATGLSWATARKFLATLELLRKIAPTIRLTPEGVVAESPSPLAAEAFEDPMARAAMYLFLHARINGSPASDLTIQQHRNFSRLYREPLEDLMGLGLAARKNNEVHLSPQGLSLASKVFASIVEATPEALALSEEAGEVSGVVRKVIASQGRQFLVDDEQQVLFALQTE